MSESSARALSMSDKVARSKLIVVDYGVSSSGTPFLTLRDPEDASDSQLELSAGERLDWRFLDERHCVGYHAWGHGRRYVPCPARSPIPSGVQCGECALRDGMLPCIHCDGTVCRATKSVETHCSTSESSIYLARFGGGLKVGVSSRGRLRERWLEQGAEEGVEVAVASSGRLARLVESRVSKEFSIPKTVRTRAKIDGLYHESTSDDRKGFSNLIDEVQSWLRTAFPDCHRGRGEIQDLRGSYNLAVSSMPFAFAPSGEFVVVGRFAGAKGPLLFFEDCSGLTYCLDLRSIRGQSVTFRAR